MKNRILLLAAALCLALTGTVASAGEPASEGQSFTITGTVATGVAAANAPISITGSDGTTLSQSTTTGTDGTYSITFDSTPSFPIQVTTTANTGVAGPNNSFNFGSASALQTNAITGNRETLSGLVTGPSSTTANLNQVTTAATNSAVANNGGTLAGITSEAYNSAGQSMLDTALGGGVSFETFSSSTFTARTSATDFTQTASVADVFLDTLGELAATNGNTVSNLLTTQTTPLLEDDTFLINASENLALVDTTETVSSVITGGTKAQAVDSIASSIRSVVSTIGTKDKAAVSAARAVGSAIANSISSTTSLTDATSFSNLANNVTLLVQSSVVSLVTSTSASTLGESDLTTLAETLGTNAGTALQSATLTTSAFSASQVSSDLSALTASLAEVGTAVESIAVEVASGTTTVAEATTNSSALTNAVAEATTTVSNVVATTETTTTPETEVVVVVTTPDVDPLGTSPITP